MKRKRKISCGFKPFNIKNFVLMKVTPQMAMMLTANM